METNMCFGTTHTNDNKVFMKILNSLEKVECFSNQDKTKNIPLNLLRQSNGNKTHVGFKLIKYNKDIYLT